MATFIEMPKLSDTMTEGTLVKWLKSEGDQVEIGDVLAEIETDKATMEMEAFDEGTLGKIYVQAGQKVPIGSALAVLVGDGEEPPPAPAGTAAPASGGQETAGAETAAGTDQEQDQEPEPAREAAPAGTTAPPQSGSGVAAGRVKASPLARRVAADLGIDLRGVAGSGPGGRVVRADVEAAAAGGGGGAHGAQSPAAAPAPVPAQSARATATAPPPRDGDRRVELSGMRAIIAQRLLESKTQIPHFYLHTEVDAAPMMALRKQLNAAGGDDGDANVYTVNDFVLLAAVAAAVDVPAVNASFRGDHIVEFADVDLSVAVALDDGLVTPVLRAAQRLSLLDLSLAVKDLATRARNKRLAPDEMTGGTITVSNLGAYGIDRFDAIINPPQAMILAIGAVAKRAVVDPSGEVVAGLRMDVGLSGDHRVVDGAVGAAFLKAMRTYLEQPALMLV